MGRLARTSLIAALALGLLATSASAQPRVGTVLRRAAEALDDVPHEGVVVTEIAGRNGSVHRYLRRIYAGHEGRMASEQTGAGLLANQRVVCDGERRWRVFGAGLVVLVSPRLDFVAERRQRIRKALAGGEGLEMRLLPDLTIAGRPAVVVEIARGRGQERRVVRALAIDRETGLQLGNTTYDREGNQISRTYYREVRMLPDEEIDAGRFLFQPQPEAVVVPEPERVEPPILFREARERAEWIVPLRRRPRDWRPEGVALPAYGEWIVAQFTYVDERDPARLRPVFLFERPAEQATPFFDEFYDLASVTTDPTVRGRAVAWRDGRLVYVLTGAAPTEELLAAARNHIGR